MSSSHGPLEVGGTQPVSGAACHLQPQGSALALIPGESEWGSGSGGGRVSLQRLPENSLLKLGPPCPPAAPGGPGTGTSGPCTAAAAAKAKPLGSL